ncbi:DUF3046 domain-containing protein [Corynebacterium nuruki]|jgi:hypothetical protein|uniref:DUF3046 domain-containing protein n=1 Tax=Corynebacterium nuruki TaxID=1032851 RepID=UPI002657805B|nr:DUF3046 domain-containing protein [Corynebacterium nuruki]
MRRTEFDRLVTGEFGDAFGSWIAGSHVLSAFGATAGDLVERGADLREVWWALCDDFDVPEDRRLGADE